MPKTTNLTYDELTQLAPKDKFFKMRVEHNPKGEGTEQELWAINECGELSTYLPGQDSIDGVDYTWCSHWKTDYKGTFDYLGEAELNTTTPKNGPNCKPEVYKAGDFVEVLESTRDCGNYEDWGREAKGMIGKTVEIKRVHDGVEGVYYWLYTEDRSDHWVFPSYAVRKVEPPDQPLELTLEQIAEKFGVSPENIKIRK